MNSVDKFPGPVFDYSAVWYSILVSIKLFPGLVVKNRKWPSILPL
jgi:hypothetical protein